jgi:transcriptional regulator with XRE-family HTH domain
MTFSELLKRLLETMELEQKDFARMVGTSPSVITDTMKGRLRPPLKKIESWADALELHGDHRAEFILHAHLAHAPEYVRKYIENLESEIGNLRDDVKEVRSLIAENEHNFESRVAVAIEQYKAKPPPIPEAWPMPKERVKST